MGNGDLRGLTDYCTTKKNKISIHTTQLQNMSLTIFNFKINLATMFKICAGDKNFLKTSNNKNGAKNIKSKDI